MCPSWWRPASDSQWSWSSSQFTPQSHLARCQDPDGPDVHGHRPVLTPEEHPALVDVGRNRVVVGGEGGVVTQDAVGGILTQGPAETSSVNVVNNESEVSVPNVVVCLSI